MMKKPRALKFHFKKTKIVGYENTTSKVYGIRKFQEYYWGGNE